MAVTDNRSPLQRLLEQVEHAGRAEPQYHEQWRTIWKAAKLGYIESEDDGYLQPLTKKGRDFLAANRSTND